jgi:hypothetical protein
MRRTLLRRAAAGLTLGLLFLLGSGCGDTVRSGKDWQVKNAADTFEFQVTDMQNYSKILEYVWTNTGTTATVNQACSISGGNATLTVKDAAGTTVYARSLKDNGTYPSTAGTAGSWLIRVELSKTDGTLNFRAQKGP